MRKAIPGNQDQPERVSVDWPGDFGGIKESWLGTAQTLVSSEYALQGPSLLPVRVNHSLIPRRNQRRPHQRRQTNLGAKAVQHGILVAAKSKADVDFLIYQESNNVE
jgi:hypothetical protein